jgi:hypothetical protein
MSIFDPNSSSLPSQKLDADDNHINNDEQAILNRTLTGGRAGEAEFVPIAPRRGSVTAQVEEIFFENFLKYFKNAEENGAGASKKTYPGIKPVLIPAR